MAITEKLRVKRNSNKDNQKTTRKSEEEIKRLIPVTDSASQMDSDPKQISCEK